VSYFEGLGNGNGVVEHIVRPRDGYYLFYRVTLFSTLKIRFTNSAGIV